MRNRGDAAEECLGALRGVTVRESTTLQSVVLILLLPEERECLAEVVEDFRARAAREKLLLVRRRPLVHEEAEPRAKRERKRAVELGVAIDTASGGATIRP